MAIHIEWGDDSKTYVYSRFHHGWTWQDNAETRAIYIEMIKNVSHRVDIVADFSNAPTLPTNLFENARQIVSSDNQANRGFFIMFGVNSFVQNMYWVVTRVIPSVAERFIIVESMQEALKIVKSDRSNPTITA